MSVFAPGIFPCWHLLFSSSKVKSSSSLLGTSNHRSGRHSLASSPHTSLSRFALRMDMINVVPFGIAILSNGSPYLDRMGRCRGKTVSLRTLTLRQERCPLLAAGDVTYVRLSSDVGGWRRSVSLMTASRYGSLFNTS